MFGTLKPIRHGRCTVCGGAHEVTAPVNGNDLPEFGEAYTSDYCCKECLDDHGPTEHVRVPVSEVRE